MTSTTLTIDASETVAVTFPFDSDLLADVLDRLGNLVAEVTVDDGTVTPVIFGWMADGFIHGWRFDEDRYLSRGPRVDVEVSTVVAVAGRYRPSMTFTEWLEAGRTAGFVGDAFCGAHDGTPYTEAEQAEAEADDTDIFDRCVTVLRVLPPHGA